jgi:hypothetical protein
LSTESLTGLCPADLNQDGTVDPADLAAFNAAWRKADVNGDGIVDGRDLD